MADDRKLRLRDQLDGALTSMMAVLPGADNEPGWDVATGDDGWTVRQLLAHLVVSEQSIGGLVQRALDARQQGAASETLVPVGPDGAPFDLDRWNKRQVEKRAGQPASALRNELSEVRTATLKTIAALPDGALDTPAWQPMMGFTTVEGVYRMVALHMKDHTRAMKLALKEAMKGRYWGEG